MLHIGNRLPSSITGSAKNSLACAFTWSPFSVWTILSTSFFISNPHVSRFVTFFFLCLTVITFLLSCSSSFFVLQFSFSLSHCLTQTLSNCYHYPLHSLFPIHWLKLYNDLFFSNFVRQSSYISFTSSQIVILSWPSVGLRDITRNIFILLRASVRVLQSISRPMEVR